MQPGQASPAGTAGQCCLAPLPPGRPRRPPDDPPLVPSRIASSSRAAGRPEWFSPPGVRPHSGVIGRMGRRFRADFTATVVIVSNLVRQRFRANQFHQSRQRPRRFRRQLHAGLDPRRLHPKQNHPLHAEFCIQISGYSLTASASAAPMRGKIDSWNGVSAVAAEAQRMNSRRGMPWWPIPASCNRLGFLPVTLGALQRWLLAGCQFALVTVDAKAALRRRVVKCRLPRSLHSRCRRLGVTVAASLVRPRLRLLRLRGVMTCLTLGA